jgi:tRNA(fMet)-specific endonuclease VapC
MNGSVLLDTNIVIALFAEEAAVLQHIVDTERAFVPAVVLGELYLGAQRSARSAANVERIRAFAGRAQVLNTDAGTADAYGRVRASLYEKGRPIPENDVWIAALAIQHRLAPRPRA